MIDIDVKKFEINCQVRSNQSTQYADKDKRQKEVD